MIDAIGGEPDTSGATATGSTSISDLSRCTVDNPSRTAIGEVAIADGATASGGVTAVGGSPEGTRTGGNPDSTAVSAAR